MDEPDTPSSGPPWGRYLCPTLKYHATKHQLTRGFWLQLSKKRWSSQEENGRDYGIERDKLLQLTPQLTCFWRMHGKGLVIFWKKQKRKVTARKSKFVTLEQCSEKNWTCFYVFTFYNTLSILREREKRSLMNHISPRNTDYKGSIFIQVETLE